MTGVAVGTPPVGVSVPACAAGGRGAGSVPPVRPAVRRCRAPAGVPVPVRHTPGRGRMPFDAGPAGRVGAG